MLRSGAVSSQEAVLCDVDGPWQAGGVCGLGRESRRSVQRQTWNREVRTPTGPSGSLREILG